MPTLYVENVPEDLYEAIRERAQKNRSSISAEVLEELGRSFPTKAELARRQKLYERLLELRSMKAPGEGPFQSTEEMLREDRER